MSHASTLKRSVSATLLAALLATTATAFAQTAPAQPGAPGTAATQAHGHERMQKRLADLKARLKIEPAQESAWTAWTASMQPTTHNPAERDQHRTAMDKLSTPERIDHMKAMRAQRDATMDKRAQATKDFYAQLNAEQKKTFDTASRRMAQGHGKRQGGNHGGGHGHHG